MKKYPSFKLKIFMFLAVKFSVYLNRRFFVMRKTSGGFKTSAGFYGHPFLSIKKLQVYKDIKTKYQKIDSTAH